ncbi:MAG: dihydrodipicolinate synthase family protein [Phycisphaeraceae bacterium]|nr:dihydrodipicolinate synthase family protein [Phycisphaeraceae bacterium]
MMKTHIPMKKFKFISAVGTPLDDQERLDMQGLQIHLNDQWASGIGGVLVGGTMGLMQLLLDSTYESLIETASEFSRGRGELLIGVGDTSLVRTISRINIACRYPIDGVVAICPYFVKFSQDELVDYYHHLADASAVPLFVYYLPTLTGVSLELDTVLRIARHPNIHGIKCSCDFDWTRQLMDAVESTFRVIVAQAGMVDYLCKLGVKEQLDGIFSVAPSWVVSIGRAAASSDWQTAAQYQDLMNNLLRVVHRYGVFPSFTALLNARGIPGNYAPQPYGPLSESQRCALCAEPVVRQLLRSGMERVSDERRSVQV